MPLQLQARASHKLADAKGDGNLASGGMWTRAPMPKCIRPIGCRSATIRPLRKPSRMPESRRARRVYEGGYGEYLARTA